MQQRPREKGDILVIPGSITKPPAYDRATSFYTTNIDHPDYSTTTTNAIDSVDSFSLSKNRSVLNTTTLDSPGEQPTTNVVYYDQTLLTADNWITITLSAVSIVALIVFAVLYILAKMKIKPKAQKKKRILVKKLFKKEHLIFSYCITLLISHIISIAHIIVSQRLIESDQLSKEENSSSEFKSPVKNETTSTNIHLTTSLETKTTTSVAIAESKTLCLVIGILRQYFWLATVLHTNVISFTMYFKLDKTLNENLINRKQRIRSAIEIYSYVYGTGFVLLCLSVIIQFSSSEHPVYNLNMTEKLFCCFLNKPVYLTLFFALPIALILIINFTLFIIVLYRTKPTLDQQSETVTSSDASPGAGTNKLDPVEYKNDGAGNGLTPVAATSSNFFLKLAIIMGLSWIVYIMTIIIIEASVDVSIIQYSLIISSLQVNLQGVIVAVGLFFNVIYEKFVKGEKSDANKVAVAGAAAAAAVAAIKHNGNARHHHYQLDQLYNKKALNVQ